MRLKEIALLIAENHKHIITSRWFYQDEYKNPLQCALMDLQDIEASDCVMVFMIGESQKGGCMVELGYAIAKAKPVIIIGERSNVFTHIVPCFSTWEEALLP